MNINWINSLWSASLFSIYVVTSCFGLYLVKAAEEWKTPTFVIGFILYSGGAVIWMIILRLMPLSFAFPVAAGSLVIGTLFIGVFFLRESISGWHVAGSILIVIGIALIAAKH